MDESTLDFLERERNRKKENEELVRRVRRGIRNLIVLITGLAALTWLWEFLTKWGGY